MRECLTDQELFWKSDFGDKYIDRNNEDAIVRSNAALFSKILGRHKIASLIEFGANVGLNLDALNSLYPDIELFAIEINKRACDILRKKSHVKTIYDCSILDFSTDYPRDCVLIKGVLIHLNPEVLDQTYKILHASSKKYICIAEYYNPTPISVMYHGNKDRLFKRDFAGEMLKKFSDLRLVDYGFVYRNDIHFPQDDLTWFLLEKE